jgi:hypothetical protein
VSWSAALLALVALTVVAAGALLAPRAETAFLSHEERALLREVGKQAVEQPLHVLMAAAPICLSRQLVGVPWYGWAITPLLAWREWSQWPSERWWDPPLDWAFQALGVILATWRRRAARPAQPRPPSHPLRRKYPSRPPATASIKASASG